MTPSARGRTVPVPAFSRSTSFARTLVRAVLAPTVALVTVASGPGAAQTPTEPESQIRRAVALAAGADDLVAEGDLGGGADLLREAAALAQDAGRPALTAALLLRTGGLLMRDDRPQLAVIAYEYGLKSLRGTERFDVDGILGVLSGMEKDFQAPSLSVPDDLYTPEGHADLSALAGDPLLPARLLLGAGTAYLAQPQDSPAVTDFRLALQVPGVDSDRPLRARILTHLGIGLRRLGHLREAEAHLAEALELVDTAEDLSTARRVHAALGALHLERGSPERARAHYEEALDLAGREDAPLGRARALAALGRIHYEAGRLREAEAAFREALRLAEARWDRDVLLHVRVGLGVVLRDAEEPEEAAEHLEEALRLVEAHQRDLRTDEGKVVHLETVSELFATLLELHLARARRDPVAWTAALRVSEGARGRATLDLMGARRSFTPSWAVPADRFANPGAQDAIATEAGGADAPGLVSPPGPEGLEGPDPSQWARGTDLPGDPYPGKPYPGDPYPGDPRPGGEAIPGADSLAAEPDPSLPVVQGEPVRRRPAAALDFDQDAVATGLPGYGPRWDRYVSPLARLSFHVLEDRTAVFSVAADGTVAGHVAELGESELAERIREIRARLGVDRVLRGVTRGIEAAVPPDPEAARELLAELYGELLAPLEADLPPEGRTVALLPHGPLWLLPFGALVDGRSRWLADRWPLVVAASPEVLDEVRREPAPEPVDALRFLVVGNPEIPDPLASGPLGLEPLPGAEAEARAIARMLPEGGRTLLLGRDASDARVRSELPSHQVVHLATHGIASAEDPLDSYVVLAEAGASGDPGQGLRDSGGLLTARQVIRELQVPADLVVLSACQTGLGRIAGEGMLGLSRSFLVAGARSVLVSLWSVSDRATTDLMRAFYAGYLSGQDKASALQQAMRFLRSDPEFDSPAYWAPFILVGAER